MNRFRIVLFFLCLTSILNVRAQSNRFVSGRIVTGDNQLPVPFATVKLKSNYFGVVSNASGDFQFPIVFKSRADTIVVSCIGYASKSVSLTTFKENELNVVTLTEVAEDLKAVEIQATRSGRLTGYKIVAAAIRNIPNNYPEHPFCYDAYYRDYQLNEKKEYINLNEAIVEVMDSGFQTSDRLKTKIKLFEYKRNDEFPRDTAAEVAYDNQESKFIPNATLKSFGGNELSILRVHDAIRNNGNPSFSFIYTFREDFLKNHLFSIGGQTLVDNVPLYVVKFQSKPSVTGSKHYAKGKIFIEKGNYAIHKIEYSTYEKATFDSKLLYDIQLEYSRINAKMYLNYISFNNLFKIPNPLDFRVEEVTIDRSINAFVVTVNHLPDLPSAMNVKNYEFAYNDVRLNFSEASIDTLERKRIILTLGENRGFNIMEHPSKLVPKLNLHYVNIRDLQNKLLNEITYVTVNQFRELFVQNRKMDVCKPDDSVFIKSDKPLSQNVIPPPKNLNTGYWMNTPLKTKQ